MNPRLRLARRAAAPIAIARAAARRAALQRLALVLALPVLPTLAMAQNSPDDAACQPPPPAGTVPIGRVQLPAGGGEPLTLTLQVRRVDGAPLTEVLLYVYHANAQGAYVPAAGATGCARFHGARRGWVHPDARGTVTVHTIRPGPYPASTEPAHLHVIVQFPGARGYYVNDVVFDDDPRLTAAVRQNQRAPGGSGVVRAVRDAAGAWRATRELILSPPTR